MEFGMCSSPRRQAAQTPSPLVIWRLVAEVGIVQPGVVTVLAYQRSVTALFDSTASQSYPEGARRYQHETSLCGYWYHRQICSRYFRGPAGWRAQSRASCRSGTETNERETRQLIQVLHGYALRASSLLTGKPAPAGGLLRPSDPGNRSGYCTSPGFTKRFRASGISKTALLRKLNLNIGFTIYS